MKNATTLLEDGWLEVAAEKLFMWGVEGTPITNAATRDWPLASASSAVAIVASYLLLVLLGSAVGKASKGDGLQFPAISFAYNLMQVFYADIYCSLSLTMLGGVREAGESASEAAPSTEDRAYTVVAWLGQT